MIVGVDFDHVLFDTESFNGELKEETGLHHVDEDVYDSNGNYSPEKHAEACGIDPQEVYGFLEDLSRFLYSDAENLEDLEHEIWIVTRGEKRFQRKKIEASGAESLADSVKIVEKGAKDVGIDFLIDDRKEEIDESGVPGYVIERPDRSLEDALEAVRGHEA